MAISVVYGAADRGDARTEGRRTNCVNFPVYFCSRFSLAIFAK